MYSVLVGADRTPIQSTWVEYSSVSKLSKRELVELLVGAPYDCCINAHLTLMCNLHYTLVSLVLAELRN